MASLRSVRIVAIGIWLVTWFQQGSIARAEDHQAPPLTAQEIADGWISLFDGESTFGWTGKPRFVAGQLWAVQGETIRFAIPLPPGELQQIPATVPVTAEPLDAKLAGITTQEATANGIRMQFVATSVIAFKGGDKGSSLTSLRYRPKRTTPLFNGKDLTGWKIFTGDPKRNLSKFDITPAGELSLKNGPGDLQTERQFDNFLLQLECKTNGTALNSGVFFRCIPDQYQNGYEMQIQNAYKENDRTKPADFGTGAIYRRIPARKVVSNDNTWFAMTLLAHGPMIATWVDGYPVVNWKDERAPDENPRKGLRTAKGHLSIQGHDPTTDLLFRNIRIVEIKEMK